jgi:RNA polymerase sigma-70 factor (ECF subfamily)
MDDKQLVQLLCDDPQEGLRQAVEMYSAYVYKIAYSKLRDVCTKEDIEEAVSDVFMSFYTYALKEGRSLRSAVGMLSVIAKRRCTDIFRAKARRDTTLPLEYANDIPSEDIYAEPSVLLEAIRQLGQPDSEIFLRRYYLGESSREIAKALGMKPNTVTKRITRGLEKLRAMIKEGDI